MTCVTLCKRPEGLSISYLTWQVIWFKKSFLENCSFLGPSKAVQSTLWCVTLCWHFKKTSSDSCNFWWLVANLTDLMCGCRRTQSTAPIIDMSSIHEPLSSRSSMKDMTHSDSKVPALKGVQPFDISMARFLDETGDEQSVLQRRHSMFKIIPRIEKGSWLVRQAVAQTPVLLGKKLTTKYFR